jgi:hypothetical protein
MMNRKNFEWLGLIIFLIVNLYLVINAKGWNDKSFEKISKIKYAIGSSGGNVRESPSINSRIKFKIKANEFTKLLKQKGDWFYIQHPGSGKKGWAHKITMRRYLHLGYYKDFVLDKSILELTWD